MNEQIKVGLGVMIVQNGCVLLGHRIGRDTGGIYEPGSWCLPGGKQEYHETIFEGAAREVKEETNLDVGELSVFSAADDIQPDRHFVTIQILAGTCSGELRAMEPHKQDEWRWFPLDALPERLYSPSEKFIRAYIQRSAAADSQA